MLGLPDGDEGTIAGPGLQFMEAAFPGLLVRLHLDLRLPGSLLDQLQHQARLGQVTIGLGRIDIRRQASKLMAQAQHGQGLGLQRSGQCSGQQ